MSELSQSRFHASSCAVARARARATERRNEYREREDAFSLRRLFSVIALEGTPERRRSSSLSSSNGRRTRGVTVSPRASDASEREQQRDGRYARKRRKPFRSPSRLVSSRLASCPNPGREPWFERLFQHDDLRAGEITR